MSKNILVLYHGNCYDGITAAWVCWLKFKEDADYIPLNYSDPPPDVKGKEVYIVDFSFKRDIIVQMRADAKYLQILDHHQTAQKELEGLPYALFDMNRSGSGLAWDFFFGKTEEMVSSRPATNRPMLVNYVEDRDLWRFKLPNSREINAWIQSWDIDLEVWKNNVGIKLNSPPFTELVEQVTAEGNSILRKQQSLVRAICFNAKEKILDVDYTSGTPIAYIGPYVQTSVLMSEVCEQMLKDFPASQFSFYSFERKDGKFQYGLRSRAGSDFDVSLLAKKFGGGGHKNAAGFEVNKPLF